MSWRVAQKAFSMALPTIGDWLSILEVTGQIIFVPPYFENFGKNRAVLLPESAAARTLDALGRSGVRTAAHRAPVL